MIIDIRTQLQPTAEPEMDSCCSSNEAHVQAMECVDVAVVLGWRADHLGVDTPAETIASFVNADPLHRVGFAGIDPLAESAFDDLALVHELGLSGVTISPADQACRPTHDRCVSILEQCAAMKLPVLTANPGLADRRSVAEFARPSLWDEVIRDLPTLTLILGDLGCAWLDETMLMISRHERVFAEISGVTPHLWSLYHTLQLALERRITHKLLFGSGFPRETPQAVMERLYSINSIRKGSSLPTAPREFLRSIIERDTLTCLGIDHLSCHHPDADAPTVHVHAGSTGELVSKTMLPAQ